MQFHESIFAHHQERIKNAVNEIAIQGIFLSKNISKLLQTYDIEIYVGSANEVGGAGCLFIKDTTDAQKAIDNANSTDNDFAKLLRLCIAEETIEIGGQEELEITLVHEGKHALDFVKMLQTFSQSNEKNLYNPTKFQHEFSAHLASAFYALSRKLTHIKKGLKLNLLSENNKQIYVDSGKILNALQEKYGLSFEKQSYRLSEISDNLKPKFD
jgi:hypothetical protein